LTATVGANGQLDGVWQQTNAKANDRGDDFLDQLGGDRQATAMAADVMVEVDRSVSDTRLSAVRQSYEEIARQFRFEDTYLRQYALFVQNTQTLDVLGVTAGAASNSAEASAAPTIYIETLGANANLNIVGRISTHSSTSQEGGIVLVAGGLLNMQGTLETEARLSQDVIRIQRVERIGDGATVDALGQAAIGYLNANAFDGGEGLTPKDPFLTSTQFVIRDQKVGLSAAAEDYRSHVFQRVVAQFGFEGEAGFVTFVGYADGEIQQFDVAGEAGARTKTLDETNSGNQLALDSAPQAANQATAFSRATAFDPQFLDANQELLTSMVARRAADFFLFENASAEQTSDIRDLTVESFQVANVFALGAQGATELPRDPDSIQPPVINNADPQPILANPVQLVRVDVELQPIQERIVEVAIYRIWYEDENQNGQADENELPSEAEILESEVLEEEQLSQEVSEIPDGKRLKLEEVRTESGGSPTAEDIEKLKNKYLRDPQRPSGAYAIIEKGLDDQEVVLDIFSVLDAEVESSADDVPLIQLPDDAQSTLDQPPVLPSLDAEAVLTPTAPVDSSADNVSVSSAGAVADFELTAVGEEAAASSSRFAHVGLVASSLWWIQSRSRSSSSAPLGLDSLDNQSGEALDLGRRGRRRRQWQRQHQQAISHKHPIGRQDSGQFISEDTGDSQ
jgi:hypothetical protein